ncbi:ankyrin repeat family protein [Wolbachia endosymbiont of Trichogramma pretiosum]|nr:ankyrin repeat family protein [Wolbachia endosymbiont of Trichogramma pretiosum]
MRLLTEKGVDVNTEDVRGHTALHLAITEKRLETVRELIKSGGNVNAEEYGNKCTPLHLACMVGEKIVEELVKAGAEIEQADKFGITEMDYAKNSKEIAEVLKKETEKMESLLKKIRVVSESATAVGKGRARPNLKAVADKSWSFS